MNVRAIVFDMYGTLVDVAAVAEACRSVAPDPDAFGETWRRKQLEYSFLSTALGRYRTFWELSERALDYAIGEAGLDVAADVRSEMMQAWLKPAPYPDTGAALEEMSQKHRLAILSNGNPEMLQEGLRHTGLTGRFSSVISADAVEKFKPSPDVYQLAVDGLDLPAESILFVSSNGFDVVGAGSFGFNVCWINRRGGVLDPLDVQPALQVSTLQELADHLAAPGTR